MKNLTIILGILCLSISSFAQSNFYWSNKKKIFLNVDSSVIVLKANNSNQKQALLSLFSNSKNLINFHDTTSFSVRFSNKVLIADKLISLSNYKISKENIIYAYKVNNSPIIPTREILYKLKKGVDENSVIDLIKKENIESIRSAKYYGSILTVRTLQSVMDIANKIYESGLVEYSHPNFVMSAVPTTNDPLYSNQYYLKNSTSSVPGADINIEPAWNIPLTNTIITVAVIDNGVANHEDLGNRVFSGYTPHTNGNGSPLNSSQFHGEECAGIIAATRDNGIGIAGICSDCNIVPVNIYTGSETVNDYVNAFNWSWDPNGGNADVLSCSFGFNVYVDAINTAINNAVSNGRGGLGCTVFFLQGIVEIPFRKVGLQATLML